MEERTEGSFKEEQRKLKTPLPYAIYKGVNGKFGVIRLSLKKAYTDSRRDKDDGCIFIEGAPADSPNHYNWEKKIVMALSVSDISKVILFLRNPNSSVAKKNEAGDLQLQIYHDKGAGTDRKGQETTQLTINKSQDRDSFFVNLRQNKQSDSNTVSVPLSQDEAVAVGTLLSAAIPAVLAWN